MNVFRALVRFIRKIVLLVVICAMAGGAFLVYEGHQLYEQALLETPVEQVMTELQNRPHYTRLEEIPQIYLDAVISTEDHRFYTHKGIDVIAITRALWHDIQAGSMVEGGSTITQQLAKNQFFTQKKELTRKIAEVFMVHEIESLYEKDEILELYINSIYYGQGYYCIYDASMGYFGKAPAELNAKECTLLAGIPNAPSVYAPTTNPDLALQRQRQVLQDMVTWGYLTREEAAAIAS
jgi:membrane peptidoglycan carboxypeptidase